MDDGPGPLPAFEYHIRLLTDSYVSFFTERKRIEEQYIDALRKLYRKSVAIDAFFDEQMPPPPPTTRKAWSELRDSLDRETQTHSAFLHTLATDSLAPLTTLRDSQERTRKRIKEDLKTSASAYSEYANETLPKLKTRYVKKFAEVNGPDNYHSRHPNSGSNNAGNNNNGASMRVPQTAPINPSSPYGSLHPSGSPPSKPTVTAPQPLRALDRRASGTTPSSRSRNRSPAAPGATRTRSPSVSGPFSDLAQQGKKQLNHLITFLDRDKDKGGGRSSTEGRDNGRDKERDREPGRDSRDRDRDEQGQTPFAAIKDSVKDSSSRLKDSFASSPFVSTSMSGGSSSDALRLVRAKRELTDADKEYRRGIHFLETLRLRRARTVAAGYQSLAAFVDEQASVLSNVIARYSDNLMATSTTQTQLYTHLRQASDSISPAADIRRLRLPRTLEGIVPSPVLYEHGMVGPCKDLLFGISLVDYATAKGLGSPTGAPAGLLVHYDNVSGHRRSGESTASSVHTQASTATLDVNASLPNGQPAYYSLVPKIVRICITEVDSRGLDSEGIYRVSGRLAIVRALQYEIEKNEDAFDFNNRNPRDDVFAVASLLKQYLRDLPEPLFRFSLQDRLQHTEDLASQQAQNFPLLRSKLRRLPPVHHATLRALLEHLARVAARNERNRMDPRNLAIVFGAVVFGEENDGDVPGVGPGGLGIGIKPGEDGPSDAKALGERLLEMSSWKDTLMEDMITNAHILFSEDPGRMTPRPLSTTPPATVHVPPPSAPKDSLDDITPQPSGKPEDVATLRPSKINTSLSASSAGSSTVIVSAGSSSGASANGSPLVPSSEAPLPETPSSDPEPITYGSSRTRVLARTPSMAVHNSNAAEGSTAASRPSKASSRGPTNPDIPITPVKQNAGGSSAGTSPNPAEDFTPKLPPRPAGSIHPSARGAQGQGTANTDFVPPPPPPPLPKRPSQREIERALGKASSPVTSSFPASSSAVAAATAGGGLSMPPLPPPPLPQPQPPPSPSFVVLGQLGAQNDAAEPSSKRSSVNEIAVPVRPEPGRSPSADSEASWTSAVETISDDEHSAVKH
ncbi:hypothetical protein HGRIS_007429 [Hohenbuehelia grisea]|uniref:Rho-GAP domain-containing protein n=1 Tax=Hohenbuehelia grisea TaxID=104357 RepID=A0ABR3J4S7_9AGAR